MPTTTVPGGETTVPLLPCLSVEDTEQFYGALGFVTTYRQTRPYIYLALRWSDIDLHFGPAPKNLDPAGEHNGGALIMIDALEPYHAAFVAAMRATYGKVLATGRPRITRLRTGASRFTVVDPSGNSLLFIRRDEPMELEYGGSAALAGLAKSLDNARVFSEFKNDDRAALRALSSGLRRHGATAPDADRALALATLIELATALGETDRIPAWSADLRAVQLTDEERAMIDTRLRDTTTVRDLLGEE